MNNVLVIHAGFGEGHKKAAHAVADAIGASTCDLLDFTFPFIKKIYSASYLITTQHFPYLWQAAFLSTKNIFFSLLVNWINARLFSSFFKYLKQENPKAIIVTHFFVSDLIGIKKQELETKLFSLITDLRVHPLWFNKGVDYYFVALDETKRDLLKLGVRGDKIATGFVPLRQGFLRSSSRQTLLKKFSLSDRPTILFVSSLRGRFPFLQESIAQLTENFNLFIIYGKNKRLKEQLESLNSAHVRFFPFYEEIWDLMSLSSVIITKPGGLTVFEGIFMKKYFAFTHYIPGQEKENMDILVKHGVAKFVQNAGELIEAINYFSQEANKVNKIYSLEVQDVARSLEDLIQQLS